jgi:hypothetical protein
LKWYRAPHLAWRSPPLKTLRFNEDFAFLSGEASEVFDNRIDVFESGKPSYFGAFGFLSKLFPQFGTFPREMPDFSTIETGAFAGAGNAEVQFSWIEFLLGFISLVVFLGLLIAFVNLREVEIDGKKQRYICKFSADVAS